MRLTPGAELLRGEEDEACCAVVASHVLHQHSFLLVTEFSGLLCSPRRTFSNSTGGVIGE